MARFRAADPDLSDREQFLSLVTAHLREHPEVVQPWQDYTDDKRTTNTHFLAGTSVGFFDGQNQVDVRTHDDPIDACAEYIYREATMILNGTRVT